MAKKTKRQARKTTVFSGTSTSTPETRLPGNSSRVFERDFNPDYGYVIKDLRRIGALAGTFFVILVILSFFLR